MSRIGRMPIAVPAGVTVDIAENNKVTVKGPKGTLERVLPAEMDIKLDGDTITDFSHSALICCIIFLICASLIIGGRSAVTISPIVSAPADARSLAVT